MRIGADEGLGHLTYCTNIHAGESWPDMERSLRKYLPAIKAQVAPRAPLGVGLRIAGSAADALADPAAFADLRELLGDQYYVFTFNGFPYGVFHGQPVKDGAYRPDWSDPERLNYSNKLGDLMAKLLPDGMTGSISTVPCTFKPWLEEASNAEQIVSQCVAHLAAHAAHLWKLRERTGKTIVLALEPEPYCLLETIEETVQFFEERLFGTEGTKVVSAHTGLNATQAEEAARQHLGVCYDVCHAAVEYEDPVGSVAALRGAGIDISKVQLSSALKIDQVDAKAAAALAEFDEPVYLHQTMEHRGDRIVRYPDLSQALAEVEAAAGNEWRSHFHVPIFLDRMEHFGTTQDFLRAILAQHRSDPLSAQLEVETYTWDVLPEQYRGVGLSDAIARELNWVLEQLGAR